MGRTNQIAWGLILVGSLACNKPQVGESTPASSPPVVTAPATPSASAEAESVDTLSTESTMAADSPESAKRECERLVRLRLASRIAAYRFPPVDQYSHVPDGDGSQEVLILMERSSGTPQFLSVGCVGMRYHAGNWLPVC